MSAQEEFAKAIMKIGGSLENLVSNGIIISVETGVGEMIGCILAGDMEKAQEWLESMEQVAMVMHDMEVAFPGSSRKVYRHFKLEQGDC